MWKQLFREWLRKCYICKQILPLDNEHFYKSKWKNNNWYMSRCKNCDKIRNIGRSRSRSKVRKLSKYFYIWYVYIIRCKNIYKIWITKHKDISIRIADMQCWNPFPLTLYKMYKVDDMFISEWELHSIFIKQRIRWERYKLLKKDLDTIDKYLNTKL